MSSRFSHLARFMVSFPREMSVYSKNSAIAGGLLGASLLSTIAMAAPGSMQFKLASQEQLESDGTVEVLVQRTGGTTGEARVIWSVDAASTAGAEQDYTAAPGGVLEWAAGDATDK